jgi:hypothetical protein
MKWKRRSKATNVLECFKPAKEQTRHQKRISERVMTPTILYVSESWILNGNYETTLDMWKCRILRRICGGKKVDDHRRRRTTEEVAAQEREREGDQRRSGCRESRRICT